MQLGRNEGRHALLPGYDLEGLQHTGLRPASCVASLWSVAQHREHGRSAEAASGAGCLTTSFVCFSGRSRSIARGCEELSGGDDDAW